MRHPDPTVTFFIALIAWGIFLAAMVSTMSCGGAQRTCAANRTGGDLGDRCHEVPR